MAGTKINDGTPSRRVSASGLTTGQVALACGASINTAIRWIDSGELPSFRLGGESHRRVERKHLVEFMRKRGMPTDTLDQMCPPIEGIVSAKRLRDESDREFMGRMRGRRTLTTGQVARLLDVAPRTVAKWIDAGRIQGYRLPGSMDRRVTRSALIKFMSENGMMLTGIGGDRPVLLVLSPRPELLGLIDEGLSGWDIRPYSAASAAGAALVLTSPDVVLLDQAAGRNECATLLALCRMQEFKPSALCLETEDGPTHNGDYDGTLRWPCSGTEMVAAVASKLKGTCEDGDASAYQPQSTRRKAVRRQAPGGRVPPGGAGEQVGIPGQDTVPDPGVDGDGDGAWGGPADPAPPALP